MQKLLIIGAGDIARRTLPILKDRFRIFALVHSPEQQDEWRSLGVRPVMANLDDRHSLVRLAGLADFVLHFAPPPARGLTDDRTRRLLAVLCRAQSLPQRIVYISTSGVYGDCGGEKVAETRPLHPTTPRAKRRADAEQRLRAFGAHHKTCVCILRAPGIYAADRLPLERLRKATPVLQAEDDVFTNHIHADDLARLTWAALRHGRPNRCYNASDDSGMKMGDYFDLVADRFGLPRPPRISREMAETKIPPVQRSFMSESRRLDNTRIKKELRAKLRHPHVSDALNPPHAV
ncbi:SDR family oxidoreductase [Propionivibrio limicola]|uniref:SDR family oxidoreductase n=1 Tax=Propionivibrio limicola TaxID=167645 RepID=UPI0012910CCD|nr:SDR family oxidoreductase [Propionivibrio limicola]